MRSNALYSPVLRDRVGLCVQYAFRGMCPVFPQLCPLLHQNLARVRTGGTVTAADLTKGERARMAAVNGTCTSIAWGPLPQMSFWAE